MADSEYPPRRRPRDIDISRSPLGWLWEPKINWLSFLILSIGIFMIFLLHGSVAFHAGWMALLLPGVAILLIAFWIGWNIVIRRGTLTWMRLAWAPAKAMACGDSVEAERAFGKALKRARRFSPLDRRRGLMLLELAGYVKNQGCYADAETLFEESVEILAHHRRSGPMDYFIALNNYAIYFVHLRDHAAAQRILERVLDLILVRKKDESNRVIIGSYAIELILHLNLVFLFVEMRELTEATLHMEAADAIFHGLSRRRRARFGDQHQAMRALLLYALGRFADASGELDNATSPDHPACLRVRARLHLVRTEFAQAEQLLRRYFDLERKKGSLHRPEMRDHTLDLAESLFGQGKHDEAFRALQEARAIVADFALPPEIAWRGALAGWLQRAKELGRTEEAASLQAELRRLMAVPAEGITISSRLRIRAPGQSDQQSERSPGGE
jgi:tetratricopeptide (TPR) repeat protein